MTPQPRVIHDNPAESPMSERDAAFLRRLAAGSGLTPQAVWRTQRAYPYLVTGKISDAADRLWVVPSATTAERRYHVSLLTGDCYFISPAGGKVPCPHKRHAGVARCAHYRDAERAERNMFGGDAAKYFAPLLPAREVA